MKVSTLLLTVRLLTALLLMFPVTTLLADSSLIGYWNFDEGSGNIIYDLSPNGNNGVVGEGAFSWVPGIAGNALSLEGGRVSFGIPNNLSPSAAITLEAWFRPVSFHGTGNDAIIDRGFTVHEEPAYQFHLGVCGDQYTPLPFPFFRAQFLFALGVNDNFNIIRTPVDFWTPGLWYHIVGTYDGSAQKLYANGILVDQKNLTGPIPDYGNTMFFGGFSNLVYRLPGTIDEIRIYSRALSADEVVQHYNSPTSSEFIIRIEKTHGTYQGSYEQVSIIKSFGTSLIGGFDFLVAYDASALSFSSASIGTAVGPLGCGWEYFTYRYGAQGNCGGACPGGLLRVIALADANNGANHPDCFTVADGAELVNLRFYVTNDRTFECQYVPIRFAWMDCGDNGISSVTGDTLFVSEKVFNFENTDPSSNPDYEITGTDCEFPIHYGGVCEGCDESEKYLPLHNIIFWNGGIDIVCADSIDAPGDLNLNDIPYEIADAVLYTNFFLYGYSALDTNPTFRQAQIAASDANQDGSVLTVGDLVYLLRVVVGDALPFPKLAPFANTVAVSVANGTVATDASVEVGAVYATFRVNGAYNLTNSTNMSVVSAENEGLVKVLVYAGLENMSNRLEAGHNNLFTINGDVELVSVEVADYNGSMLNTRINKNVLPTEFKLSQNTPNPFNPTTKIGLDLPTASDWTLSIYNVAGQLVKSFNGRGVGTINVEWDATNAASGIYFYTATADGHTASRKMILLK